MRPGPCITGLFLWIAVHSQATAAPCAGFTDVDSTQVSAEFCLSVEWLKNRGVTLGCTSATLYCPFTAVNRMQMAAFMKRLGEALEPEFVVIGESGIQVAVNLGANVCQTLPYVIQGYPRLATANAMLYHQAANMKTVFAQLRYSTDGGSPSRLSGRLRAIRPAASRRSRQCPRRGRSQSVSR